MDEKDRTGRIDLAERQKGARGSFLIRISISVSKSHMNFWKLLQVLWVGNEAKHLQIGFLTPLSCASPTGQWKHFFLLAVVSVPALGLQVMCHTEKHFTESVLNPWQALGLDWIKGADKSNLYFTLVGSAVSNLNVSLNSCPSIHIRTNSLGRRNCKLGHSLFLKFATRFYSFLWCSPVPWSCSPAPGMLLAAASAKGTHVGAGTPGLSFGSSIGSLPELCQCNWSAVAVAAWESFQKLVLFILSCILWGSLREDFENFNSGSEQKNQSFPRCPSFFEKCNVLIISPNLLIWFADGRIHDSFSGHLWAGTGSVQNMSRQWKMHSYFCLLFPEVCVPFKNNFKILLHWRWRRRRHAFSFLMVVVVQCLLVYLVNLKFS